MSEQCELRNVAGTSGIACEREDCVFWHVTDHVGVPKMTEGCAIQYLELLDQGPEMVEWLLSVKQRVDEQLQ